MTPAGNCTTTRCPPDNTAVASVDQKGPRRAGQAPSSVRQPKLPAPHRVIQMQSAGSVWLVADLGRTGGGSHRLGQIHQGSVQGAVANGQDAASQ